MKRLSVTRTVALTAWFVLLAGRCALAQAGLPLLLNDNLGGDGTISVGTTEWRVVFDRRFNGGPSR